MTTTLYLIRHGETYENQNHIFQGVLDTKLTPLGLRQADALGDYFKQIAFDAAYTSPLSRARDTLTGVLKYHPDIAPILRDDLHEIAGGALQGLTFAECNARFDNILDTFRSEPSAFAPPGGESIPEVYVRFTAEILALLRANPGRTIVVVSHGTAIQTWLAYAKGLPADRIAFDFLPNGSVSQFAYYDDGRIETVYIGRLPESDAGVK